jgi:hypothetical protein
MRGRMAGMKHLPKVRWYPYRMLGLGTVFLLFAIADLCFYEPPGPSWLMRFAWGIYGGNHIGESFATSIFVGFLLVAIGINALWRQRK